MFFPQIFSSESRAHRVNAGEYDHNVDVIFLINSLPSFTQSGQNGWMHSDEITSIPSEKHVWREIPGSRHR